MNGDTVGQIKYDASIDTATLKSSAAQSENIVKNSVNNTERAVSQSSGKMSQSLNGVGASVAAIGTYLAATKLKDFLSDSVDQANRMQGAMIGLTTVSSSYGQSAIEARNAARDLSQDGLIPVTESAAALKNLLSSGFSVDQATRLLAGLKDQAAFNRQSFYDLGGAVVATTEGIKNGNSVLADATGTTKNLSVMAKEAGVGIDQMGSIANNSTYRMAVLNGFLDSTNRSMGDAARYSQTAAGADAALSVQTQYLEARVGDLANAIRQPLVEGLAQFIAGNQQAIISVGTGILAFASFAAGAYGGVKALAALRVGLTLLARHPAVAILAVIFGILASSVMDKVMKNMDGATSGMDDFGGATGKAADQVDGLDKQAAKLQKQLAQIDEQIAKTNRDFTENLAEMVRSHQKTIVDLKAQLAQNDADFKKSYDDRLAKFNEEQGKEEESHQQKVTALQAQIDFLRRYNNTANAQQLSDLQFALAQENAQYNQKTADRQAQLDKEVADEKTSRDQKNADLQQKLNAETALLQKHAKDVASVRNVDLLDEIDKLKRSRNEQLASLNQQKADAIANAKSTTANVGATYNQLAKDLKAPMKSMGNTIGKDMGDAFKRALFSTFNDMWNQLVNFANNNPFQKWLSDMGKKFGKFANNNNFKSFFEDAGHNFGKWLSGRAAGGPVSPGQAYAVGDNPDGSWNKTTELFVPKQSGTIIPADEVQRMAQGGTAGGGMSVNIKIDLSGVMTSSAAEERALAKRLIDRFNEELRAKGIPQIGVAA
ncbi:hypothetical protein [Streptomyces sp. BBFR109]|uniref:hypothetical protein n=1 Tax=Streptomyces sp. BBFR109 TaxID=3448172 RepID=UPI003F75C2A9